MSIALIDNRHGGIRESIVLRHQPLRGGDSLRRTQVEESLRDFSCSPADCEQRARSAVIGMQNFILARFTSPCCRKRNDTLMSSTSALIHLLLRQNSPEKLERIQRTPLF
ncbi:hypothetical protein ACQR16_30585 [Bradyrhizobium oligotrophicum]|uniref:hypothetical protein n=1 Tax=Bradyrhizobium oligotrophicum TaxID=44255 RepID=UPI003EB8AF66